MSRSSRERGTPAELRAGREFYRAHGLGNDYLVFEGRGGAGSDWRVTPATVRRVCDRHEGLGSDGIVVLLDTAPEDGVFPLRMFNPDGSEFERSGNGLRVLASYLSRRGLVGGDPFAVTSGGSRIPMTVYGTDPEGYYDISIEMGRARVGAPAVRADRDRLTPDGGLEHPELGPIAFVPVSIGNPHAVVFSGESVGGSIDEVGPFLGRHPAFANGTNVQLVRVVAPDRIEVDIWERGVGRTTASGTSSCAAAVAAVESGRVPAGSITVEMEGGSLEVKVTPELNVVLRGPVEEIAEGRLTDGFLRTLD